MNLKSILALSALLSPLAAFPVGDITGKVVTKEKGEPVEFATVQLVNAATGKPLPIGTNTDENGYFRLPAVKDGKYLIKVTNVGSIAQERPVDVAGSNIDLGTVKLADDTKLLQEVVVEGIKSQMRFELDKKVFSVDANVTAAGQSASELLENIPSVEVDQDGEVSLRGNSSVTIWINGKESGLTADNRAQILEQIPAETIDRIEVITNPSAKYSPEGTAGIINIILKKDRRAGYYGSAELSANTRGGGNASVNINYNSSKVDAFAGVGFRMRHNTGGSLMRRDFDNGTYTNSDGESPSHGNGIFFRLGATYHLTDNDDISANGFGMFGHNWGHSTTNYVSNVPGNWTSNINSSRNNGDMRMAHGELSYVHKWSDNHSLDVTAAYDYWGNKGWTSYLQDITYALSSSDSHDTEYQERNMRVNSNKVEVKMDYTNQLSDNLKLETGYNGNFSHENSPIDYFTGSSFEDMAFNPSRFNRFIYSNNINALYATLGGKAGKFSFSAGLRAEQWQVKTRSLSCLGMVDGVPEFETKADVPEYTKNNFALFPSAFISYALPHDNELQINYTRRLRRPWGGQLNSFRDYSDPTNVSYGNPELQPQYSNSFELNYLKSWTYHIISVSAYLRTTSNMLNRVSALDGEVMYSTWANVADQTNSGCEIVVKNSLFRSRLDLTTTVNLYNNHIGAWSYNFLGDNGFSELISGDSQNSFAWDARVMASVRLPWSLSMQATGKYNSKTLTAQGARAAGWELNLGLRKNVGAWSFSLNCRDVLNSRRFKGYTYGPGYTQYSERWRGGTTVRLTIKYSFGNMKSKKERERGDDEMERPEYESAGMQ